MNKFDNIEEVFDYLIEEDEDTEMMYELREFIYKGKKYKFIIMDGIEVFENGKNRFVFSDEDDDFDYYETLEYICNKIK